MDKKITMESVFFQLDDKYSTTRRVTNAKSVIVSNSEDKVQSVLFLPDNSERKSEGGLRTQGYFKQNESDKPLISVITVVFNGEKYLEQTILSVINQSYDNVEYIIIDGGSTDRSLDIVRKYEGQIDYWVSEPDKGIADAFNKGISLCTGEMIGIINSDDWYESDVFKLVSEKHQYDIVHGKLQYWRDELKKELMLPNEEGLDKENTLHHPTCFVRLEVYKEIGVFDERIKIAMDYDFFLRAKRSGFKFYYLPCVISNMRYLGVSDVNWILTYKDFLRVKIKNDCNPFFAIIYFFFQMLRRYARMALDKIGLHFFVEFYRKNFSIMKKL